MIASIVTAKFDKATLDEAVEKYAHMQDGVVKYQPGWQSSTLLIDRSTGDGVSIVFWESQDSAEALFTSETYKEITAHLAAHFQSTVERRIYEVAYRS